MSSSERGCLLFHGFSGGPFEVKPLADFLEQRGWSCRVPLLPGHGARQQRSAPIRYQDWIRAAEIEAKSMVEHFGAIDLIGFSMGGLISAYLANRYPIRKLVLLNAAIIYVSPARFMQVTKEQLKMKDWSRFRKVRKIPLIHTWQFIRIVHYLKPEINWVETPALIIQGEKDQIIHPYSANYIHRHIKSDQKSLKFFDKSKHLICLGEEAQEVFKSVHSFLKN